MNYKIHAHAIAHKILHRYRRSIPLKVIITMKLTGLFILAFNLNITANAIAQHITLSVTNAPLEQVIGDIRRQSKFDFIYDDKQIKKAKPVTVNFKYADIHAVLNKIFANQPLEYEVVDNLIIIQPRSNTTSTPETSLQQTIRGRVTDSLGNPLQGVTIQVKESGWQTMTDRNGQYEITGVYPTETLHFRLLSYQPYETSANRPEINVVLKISYSYLDEPIVIGYGISSRRLNTGNVSKVSGEIIARQPITNTLNALSGRVAGLQIIQDSGIPGSSVTVRIRGQNSIGASNNPLYIVDGVPFSSSPIERFGRIGTTSGLGSPLNSINPNDIESIEVLKDADATAIYGSRAANGVILITTKKGKAGEQQFTVDINSGIGQVVRKPTWLNTEQYLQLRQDAFRNSGVTPTEQNAPDLLLWGQQAQTNWEDFYIGETTSRNNATLGFRAGNQLLSVSLNGGYFHESYPSQTSSLFRRGNLQLNVRYQSLDNRFTVETSTFYTGSNNTQFGDQTLTYNNIAYSPNFSAYNAEGNFNFDQNGNHPIANQGTYLKSNTQNLNGAVSVAFEPVQGLFLRVNLGINRIGNDAIGANPKTAINPLLYPTAFSTFANQFTSTRIAEPQISYKKTFGKGLVDVLAGSTIQSNFTQGHTLNVNGYTDDNLIESLNYGNVSFKFANTIEYRYLSFFTRLTYNWDNKYIVNGTLRRDGSTRFGPDKQFGNFGSVGAAWLLSNERFVHDNMTWLSFAKLRGSYGTTGNDGISDYGYLNLFANTANYGSEISIRTNRIANPDYSWEVNKKLEVGLDLGFFNDRVLLNTAWYRNRSGNQLVTFPLPTITGFTGYTANLPALVQNTGWEFEINTTNISKNDFIWSSSLNLTIPRNKLLSFPDIEKTSYANTLVIGKSLGIIQRFHYLDVDAETGLAILQDVNNDGNFTAQSSYNNRGGDYIIAGQTDPYLMAGLNNSISYKGFQLDAFLQYVKQDGFNLLQFYYGNGPMSNVWTAYLDYWKEPGDIGKLPRPYSLFDNNSLRFSMSDATVSDASFLRLKNVSLSYLLPRSVTGQMKVKALRVYAQGQNLFTFTPFNSYDPETMRYDSRSTVQIPPLRMLTFGLNITF